MFLQSRYKFYTCWRDPGTRLIGAANFIPGYKTGWEYRRSVGIQFFSVPEVCQGILDFNCVQMRVSGCRNHYKFVFDAGAKAKTVTNNLPILSVLKGVLR